MKSGNLRLVQSIAGRGSDFAQLLAEHKLDQKGQVLPHIFMGEVVQWAIEAAAAKRFGEIADLFAFLESEFAQDESIRELIAVSFLENLPHASEPEGSLRDLLGPHLREELERLEA